MKTVHFICWNCKLPVPLDRLSDTCPHCDASLTPYDYDSYAQEVAHDLQEIKSTEHELKQASQAFKKKVSQFSKRHRILLRLFKKGIQQKTLAYEEKLLAISKDVAAQKPTLDACAISSYCASEWFRQTNILPRLQGGNADSPFAKVEYSDMGSFVVRLKAHDRTAAGTYGEYKAFDLLTRAVELGELGEAHLAYNVLIPKIHESRTAHHPRYAQIDFLLITQKAVYVIEAKNLNGNIECFYRKKHHEYQVYVSRCKRDGTPLNAPRLEDYGPAQNKEHKRCLLEQCMAISPDETINIIAYVKKHAFYAPEIHSQRANHVATLDESSMGLVNVIKAIESARPELRTSCETKALFNHVQHLFMDIDGNAAREHSMQIANLKRIRALYR